MRSTYPTVNEKLAATVSEEPTKKARKPKVKR